MKIWISTKFGTSNIPSFKNYKDKEEFFKKRTDPEIIKLIEVFNEKYQNLLNNISFSEIEKIFGLKRNIDTLEYKYTDETPVVLKKLFDKLKKYGFKNSGFTGLKVIDVSGKKIKFAEYDGSEYIETYNDMEWFLV